MGNIDNIPTYECIVGKQLAELIEINKPTNHG